jgi:hypothetical protein
MKEPDPHDLASDAAAQINDLFDAVDVAKAINSEEFRQLLDRIPIPIIISKFVRGDHRICYANSDFEGVIGMKLLEFAGRGWSILRAADGVRSFNARSRSAESAASAVMPTNG